MKTIGIVTIGQSPRPDVVEGMAPFFGRSVKILERGALDGLTLSQVEEFYPNRGQTPLCTRMTDGTEVIIAKEKILSRIGEAIAGLNREKASLILLLCVGAFPRFQSSSLVIQPQEIVNRCVEAVIRKEHHLGVVIPIPEQEAWVRRTFAHVTPRITVTDASPYGDRRRVARAGRILKSAGCDLIVMYCMGFTRTSAKEIRSLTGKPVIVSSSLVARTMGELLESA